MASGSPSYKDELGNLNVRLATYIDRVRTLENVNEGLYTQVSFEREKGEREFRRVTEEWKQKYAVLQNQLDETAGENVKHQDVIRRLQTDIETLTIRCTKAESAAATTSKALKEFESKTKDLDAYVDQLKKDLECYIAEKRNMAEERETRDKRISELEQQLMSETVARGALERRNQALSVDLELKEKQFNEESQLLRTKEAEIDRMKEQLQEKHYAHLQDSLQELRELHEIQIKKIREEIMSDYDNTVRNLEKLAEEQKKIADTHVEQFQQSRSRIEGFKKKVSELESSNDRLKYKLGELEENMQNERITHTNDIAEYQREIMRLREDMAIQLQANRELKDGHGNVHLELAKYRKLLEIEESRLHLTPQDIETQVQETPETAQHAPLIAATPACHTQATTAQHQHVFLLDTTPPRHSPARTIPSPPKRKRTITDESTYYSADEYSTTYIARGYIELVDVDSEGKFISLQNKSGKKVSLGGWQLVHKADNTETIYKFHSSFKIPARATVTVWSAGSNTSHAPPATLVMREQRWFVANEMVTELRNESGMVVAEVQKTGVQPSTSFHFQDHYGIMPQMERSEAEPSTSRNYGDHYGLQDDQDQNVLLERFQDKEHFRKDKACSLM